MNSTNDIWSEWLRHRRFGGDEAFQKQAMQQYQKWASDIVERADIFDSAAVLDIGAGDGLVGLEALTKLGPKGKLILSDISEAALAIPKEIFNEKNIQDERVEFLIAGAEDLSPLPGNSVDRVVMRSVLLYVEDKQAAFNEIFRVLRSAGKAVLWEPVNQRMSEYMKGLFRGYRMDREPLLSVKPLIQKIAEEMKKLSAQTQNTLVGYNEHDLVNMAINAGFEEIDLEYNLIRSAQVKYASWDMFFESAPNPRARSIRETMNEILTKEEFQQVEKALREVIQQAGISTKCLAMLVLKK
ncbi:MAG: methyltransferase domain-containing protein [Ignavibacteriae bacterium]|nr:MAG: methyltransferase domain-containing protein [Ignavibacteriota bacterium]